MTDTNHADAAIVLAATAAVLAPIDPQALRDLVANLTTPEPTPATSVLDEALIARVRTGLGLPYHWRPVAENGETATRVSMWSQIELNAVFERVGGTVTSRQVERGGSNIPTTVETEITVTVELPGIGRVEAFTDWYEDYTAIGGGRDLPVMRALAPSPAVQAVAELHANCERVRCADCRQNFDECDAPYYEDQDARLCGDCEAGRAAHADDYFAWISYAYR